MIGIFYEYTTDYISREQGVVIECLVNDRARVTVRSIMLLLLKRSHAACGGGIYRIVLTRLHCLRPSVLSHIWGVTSWLLNGLKLRLGIADCPEAIRVGPPSHRSVGLQYFTPQVACTVFAFVKQCIILTLQRCLGLVRLLATKFNIICSPNL